MTPVAEQLKRVLRELPHGDRAELIHFLVDSLAGDNPPVHSDGGEQFDEMLQRRLDEALKGLADLEPASDGIARLRKKYA